MSAGIVTVQSISDSIGVCLHHERLASIVSDEIQDVISRILIKSTKIQRKCCRKELRSKDINMCLLTYGFKVLLGYSNWTNLEYQRLGTFESQSILVLPDKEIVLDEYEDESSLHPPTEEMFSFSWLAVDGDPSPEHCLDQKHQSTVLTVDEIRWPQHFKGERPFYPIRDVNSVLISKTLTEDFIRIARSITSNEDLAESLEFMRSNYEIYQMLPFLIKFLTDTISTKLSDPLLMMRIISILDSLFSNQKVRLELFAGRFLSMVFTFIANNTFYYDDEEQIEMRTRGSALAKKILSRLKTTIPLIEAHFQQRLWERLLDTSTTLPAKYGIICTLLLLDPLENSIHLTNLNNQQPLHLIAGREDNPMYSKIKTLIENGKEAIPNIY